LCTVFQLFIVVPSKRETVTAALWAWQLSIPINAKNSTIRDRAGVYCNSPKINFRMVLILCVYFNDSPIVVYCSVPNSIGT
jgi:hypothetical protein